MFFVIHPNNILVSIWVATENDRLHKPLYLPDKSLIWNQTPPPGRTYWQRNPESMGTLGTRIYETNGVSYNEVKS